MNIRLAASTLQDAYPIKLDWYSHWRLPVVGDSITFKDLDGTYITAKVKDVDFDTTSGEVWVRL